VRFTEAIDALRRRLALGSEEWRALESAEGATATRAADEVLKAVTRDLLEAVLQAVEDGTTFEAFRADYDRIVTTHGWRSPRGAGWHAQLVYRMQTSLAFAAGRREQAERLEAARPGTTFGRLVTVGDHRVRHAHAQTHGIIRPIGDAYWQTHWPPNGFNCRCYVQVVTAVMMRSAGWDVTAPSEPAMKIAPDAGWGLRH
jgi:SPP1 gp7 family putative phage head morphogenesis protein